MSLLDLFRRKTESGDGRTAETAILLTETDRGAALAAEYRTLEMLFGVRDLDWQILSRSRSRSGGGRDIELFVVGTRDQRREEVHFDASGVAEQEGAAEVRRALAGIAKDEGDLTLSLPPHGYLTLWKIIEEVADRLSFEDFAFDFVRVSVLQAMAAHDLRSDTAMDVTMRVMDWAAMRPIVRAAQTGDARAQEMIDALAARLDAALAAGNSRPGTE